MRDIDKWYMRGFLTLASVFLWFHILISFMINLLVRESGFLLYLQVMPFRYLNSLLEHYSFSYDMFEIFLIVIFLSWTISSFLWPRILIWPVIAANLLICLAIIELFWRYAGQELPLAHTPYNNIGTLSKKDWLIGRGFFLFVTTAFTAFLLPAAFNIVKGTNWYENYAWKRRS